MFEILERRISYRNIGWTKDRLWLLIVDENPCISYKEGKKKANMVHKELNKMNFNSHYNTKKYFDNNIPLSYFENDDNCYDFLEFFNDE